MRERTYLFFCIDCRQSYLGFLGSAQVTRLKNRHYAVYVFQDYASETKFLYSENLVCSRQRPYHVESTSSRPITEVKQR